MRSFWAKLSISKLSHLPQNDLTGDFPNQLGGCKNLHFLDLSANNFTGVLAEELPVPCMTVFDVSGNVLSGPIPQFSVGLCALVPSWSGNLFETDDRALPYKSFFVSKILGGTILSSLGEVGRSVFHNFGQNNFVSMESLPIARDRLGKGLACS